MCHSLSPLVPAGPLQALPISAYGLHFLACSRPAEGRTYEESAEIGNPMHGPHWPAPKGLLTKRSGAALHMGLKPSSLGQQANGRE
ncbi:hypothetical protein SAT01_27810 [Sinomonas atrocyanea]|nr:hypothetical protein SAT01_27810 [Sinomonas atrocyanea]GGG59152.1 hypothetical protein GCM10007172_07530 [Sinomonas atrocyanea]